MNAKIIEKCIPTLNQIKDDERGSLALEQVLFIGAIVAMSVGLFSFFDELREYFTTFSVSNLPTTVTRP